MTRSVRDNLTGRAAEEEQQEYEEEGDSTVLKYDPECQLFHGSWPSTKSSASG